MATPAWKLTYPDLALALLRGVAGLVFAVHGAQKLFVFGIAGVQQGFAQMGAPLPALTGPLIGVLEFVGGLALIIGLATRVFGALLTIDMLSAFFIVHLANGFFVPGGVEFVLTLAAIAAALALAGPGRFSVDAAMGRRRAAGAT